MTWMDLLSALILAGLAYVAWGILSAVVTVLRGLARVEPADQPPRVGEVIDSERFWTRDV